MSPNYDYDGMISFINDKDGDFDVYRIKPDGTGYCRVTNDTSVNGSPSVSPDGTRAAWNGAPLSVYASDLDGANTVKLNRGVNGSTGQSGAPNFCPNGWVVYTSDRTGSSQVYKVDPSDPVNTDVKITNVSGGVLGGVKCCEASGGVEKIVYTTGGGSVTIANFDGSGASSLVSGSEGDPSGDCAKITYVSGSNIFIINSDGSGNLQLTTGANTKGSPSLQ